MATKTTKTTKVYFYGTGRRKNAVACVRMVPGKGNVTVNGRELEEYFGLETLKIIVKQPLVLTATEDKFDLICKAVGGGLSGQAGAVKHGISQALTRFEPVLRGVVKAAGFLTRDPRAVERKKYGKAKARKSFQFSKR